MKRLPTWVSTGAFGLAITIYSSPSWAQASPRVTVQVDPLTTALGYVHLQTELTLDRSWSVYAGPHAKAFEPVFGDPDDVRGVGAELGVRYYFAGSAPEGTWALLRGVMARVYATGGRTEANSFGGYVSGLAGYTWVLGYVVLSAGGGIQYVSYRAAGRGPKSILPAAHTAVGVAF